MPRIKWDEPDERLYETGIEQGVLYVMEDGEYGDGVCWNGLTSVTENRSGAEPNDQYADNMKYLSLRGTEDFGLTIEAFMYPDAFRACDGSAEIATGVYAGQQKRATFGMATKTRIGNAEDGDSYGYKLHLYYGLTASPSERNYETINDSPEAAALSWECDAVPLRVAGIDRPLACIEIDSTKADATKLKSFEDIIYGVDGDTEHSIVDSDPRLPLPAEVISHFTPTPPGP